MVAAPAGTRKPVLATVVGIGSPVLVFALYALLGNPGALNPEPTAGAAGEHALGQRQIEAITARLAERLRGNGTTAMPG